MPSPGISPDQIQRQLSEIDQYKYLPEAIRDQMKQSLERQAKQAAFPIPAAPSTPTAAPATAPTNDETPAREHQPSSRGY